MNKKKVIKLLIMILISGVGYFGWDQYQHIKFGEAVDKLKSRPAVTSEVLPAELAAYSYVSGNVDSEYVIIDLQGGPVVEFETMSLLYLEDDVVFKHVSQEYNFSYQGKLPEKLKNALFVNIHQFQTLNSEIFTKEEISFSQAKEYDKETIKMTQAVIDYFKSQGKKVYVIGTSFGAFVTQDLLATYGNVADGYLIVVGRLDIPEEFWQGFSRGESFVFKDGVTIEKADTAEAGMGGDHPLLEKNMPKLAAGLGYKRYTELLKDVSLDNVIYISGEHDEQVGRLSDSEKGFLKEKGVELMLGDGGHEDVALRYTTEGLIKLMGLYSESIEY